jgi:hypothetical protein
MRTKNFSRFFKTAIGIQVQSVVIAYIASYFPDGLNRFFELTGNKPQQLGQSFDVLFRFFTATMGYLITYYNGQINRLMDKYTAQAETLTRHIESATSSLRSDVSAQIAEDLQNQPIDTLLARHGTESRSALYLARFIGRINDVLKRKSPNFSRAALALLDLSIQQWERRVDDAQSNGFDLSMDEFYRLANTLLPGTESLMVIDPTLYTSEESFSTYFKVDFIPTIRWKISTAPAEGRNKFAFYTVIPNTDDAIVNKSIAWMDKWYESEKIPLFVVKSNKMRKYLYEQFQQKSLFVFDDEIVIEMTAAEDWNAHELSLKIRLWPISRNMKDFCDEVKAKSVHSSSLISSKSDC